MNDGLRWRGFSGLYSTNVPDEWFDDLAPQLNYRQLKVANYLIRRTFGFKRQADNVSISQMVHGLKINGEHVDRGVGLSEPSILLALKELERGGVIESKHHYSDVVQDGRTVRIHETTTWSLRFISSAARGVPKELGEGGTQGAWGGVPQQVGEGVPKELGDTEKQIRDTERTTDSSSLRSVDEPPTDETRDDVKQVCQALADSIKHRTGQRVAPNKTWRNEARMLLDGAGEREPVPVGAVLTMINWLADPDCWFVVQSPKALRAKWLQLVEARHRRRSNGNGRVSPAVQSAREKAAERDAQKAREEEGIVSEPWKLLP